MKRRWIASLVALLASFPCATAWAQYELPSKGISVSGIGTVKGRPNLAKIEIRLTGKAEITEDALVKYRDNRRRLKESLEKLKMENMNVSERNVSLSSSIGQSQGMGGGGQNESAPTEISGSLRIELTKLEEMPIEDVLKTIGKVLDAVRDAGGSMGPSSQELAMMGWYGRFSKGTTVKFVLNDFNQLREKAYEAAVEDARKRGERLAKLNGIKLLGVTDVREVQVPGDNPSSSRSPYYYFYGFDQSDGSNERGEIVVENLADIPVTVQLMVRFEIAQADSKPSGGESK
jgi:uncharacterized protein YggE